MRERAVPRPSSKLRLVSTGTEATMTAIRLARGVTGRDLLVKFAGHYHGHSDGLLAEAGSGVATLAPARLGRGARGDRGADPRAALQRPRRRARGLRRARRRASPRSSSRPPPPTWASSPPDAGFNAALAELAHAHGALLILDEVLTGFRVGAGGLVGRSSRRRTTCPTSSPSARSSAAACRSPRSAVAPRSWTCSRRSARCTRPAR